MLLTKHQPNFKNLLDVLACKVPERPVLFELFLNTALYEKLANRKPIDNSELEKMKLVVDAFAAAGYDYATLRGSAFMFEIGAQHKIDTISLNENNIICDRQSFQKYEWKNPDDFDYTNLEKIGEYMPKGMKIMCLGPGGVLENAISLVGYDNLCYMIYEDEELAQDIFNAIGERLLKYYENCLQYDSVGVIMSNDDWGFNTQTFLSPEQMRKFVFPWHKKIAALAHKYNRPAILHSCGNMVEIMEDVIEDMKYDGRHSYEDNIIPVEEAYKRWGGRIAIIGGIDVDFLIRQTPEEIQKRCKNMLQMASKKGGYALGSGNSIPEYVPINNYFAMIECAQL